MHAVNIFSIQLYSVAFAVADGHSSICIFHIECWPSVTAHCTEYNSTATNCATKEKTLKCVSRNRRRTLFAHGSALIFSNISNDHLFVLTHSHVIIFASCDARLDQLSSRY